MTTRKERMYAQIERHGENLKRIFDLEGDPVALCKKLHRIEVKAHSDAESYCNGEMDSEEWEARTMAHLKRLNMVIGFKAKGVPVFVNGDPRGYALKIDDEYVRENNLTIHKDWGGYGIISPEYDGSL